MAWLLAAGSLVLVAAAPLFLLGEVMDRPGVHGENAPGEHVTFVVIVAAFTLSGAWLVRARPRNPIGWILLASGVLQAVQRSTELYGTRAVTDPDQSLPLGLTALWVASWTWMPSLLIVVAVLPGLYPSGRPASRLWVWQIRLAATAIALVALAVMTTQGGVDDAVDGTRLPWDLPAWWPWVVGILAAASLAVAVAIAVVGTLVRVVRATSPERQQLLLLLVAITAMVGTVFLPLEFVFPVAYAAVPVAVMVGVLRYRLLGIEVALRKTLLYVPLTLMIALIIGGTTTVLARLLPDGPLALLIGSGVVAALFFPISGFLRRGVDRFILGGRADPLGAVTRVTSDVESSGHDPVASMLDAVTAATGATYATVTDASGAVLAATGAESASLTEAPLLHGGDRLGTLRIAPRKGERRVTDQDARLVAALAPHFAVVLRSQQLTQELDRERRRVTTATLAERDRLRRDLHDGLGPSLSGIALGIQAATQSLDHDPAASRVVLDRTRAEAERAVAEIRRVLQGLRPSVLDERSLVDALHQAASSMGFGQPGHPLLSLDSTPLPVLRPEVEETAFRIVAESLNNVARHSGAAHCTVSFTSTHGDLRIGIVDDGHWHQPSSEDGVGVPSMHRRATDLGGHLSVIPGPDGTVVEATLPMEAR
ncbi:hypothetical protein N802_10615 [Knoellia sinensis KCTC 19936]|uniref:Signal transduction histidine kinase subgroup 3 dimerisation and phosphoacceptor domain-containing protein n=1 Tax=Knoellia sinensis KCTC 19936 TaxID=1385520 RepID=A0A0A0J5W8_9MICO|nr:hypothetical protein N802_10615 [Knoellia sinensis KCTC 19936]